jgi:hypothetical protein
LEQKHNQTSKAHKKGSRAKSGNATNMAGVLDKEQAFKKQIEFILDLGKIIL